jgi:hypothetical protein
MNISKKYLGQSLNQIYQIMYLFIQKDLLLISKKIDTKFVEEYNQKGYGHIKGVFSYDQIEELKSEA